MHRHEPNRRRWDEITPIHVASGLYDVDGFLAGADTLEACERAAVGDVDGKRLLHLMCHFGLDSLSWARHGARVTGVDFSAAALDVARDLARKTGLDARARFVASDVLDLDLGERFDVVYTSRGVIGWLSDLDAWARVVARHLAPDGLFYLQEFHPVSWLFDTSRRGPYQVKHDYFHDDAPLVEDVTDYADPDYQPEHPAHSWIWSLGDVLNALIGAGLRVTAFNEHAWTRFHQFPDLSEEAPGHFVQPEGRPRIPLVYELTARHG